MKGKGLMLTYWVLGMNVSASQITSPALMPAGVPQAQTPSLQRQTSQHSSLAAVVFGMMQASKRSNLNTTRKYLRWLTELLHQGQLKISDVRCIYRYPMCSI